MKYLLMVTLLTTPLMAGDRFTNKEGSGAIQRTPSGVTITVLEKPSQAWKDRAALTAKVKPAYLLIKRAKLASGKQVIVQETSRQQELTADELAELRLLGYEIEEVNLH